MNFIVVIIVMVVLWLVYSMLQSYRGMQEELRLIRMKCVGKSESDGDKREYVGENVVDPVTRMRSTLLSVLETVKQYSG